MSRDPRTGMQPVKEQTIIIAATDKYNARTPHNRAGSQRVNERELLPNGSLTATSNTLDGGRQSVLQVFDDPLTSSIFLFEVLKTSFEKVMACTNHCFLHLVMPCGVNSRLSFSPPVQALPKEFFEKGFDAVRHDLSELAQLADQAQMEALAETRTAALEVLWLCA